MNRPFGGGAGAPRGNAQNLTGAGEGQTEQTLGSEGGSTPHRVGRGVTAP
jgi:hypothetical protein